MGFAENFVLEDPQIPMLLLQEEEEDNVVHNRSPHTVQKLQFDFF